MSARLKINIAPCHRLWMLSVKKITGEMEMSEWDAAVLSILVFHRASELAMKGNREKSEKSSEKILSLLEKRKTASAREIAEILGVTPRAVEKHIAALKTAGRIKRVGPAIGGWWEVVQ